MEGLGESSLSGSACTATDSLDARLESRVQNLAIKSYRYPGRDSNSYSTLVLADFESAVSTDSTTRARADEAGAECCFGLPELMAPDRRV